MLMFREAQIIEDLADLLYDLMIPREVAPTPG